jgi:hypothetical protein
MASTTFYEVDDRGTVVSTSTCTGITSRLTDITHRFSGDGNFTLAGVKGALAQNSRTATYVDGGNRVYFVVWTGGRVPTKFSGCGTWKDNY